MSDSSARRGAHFARGGSNGPSGSVPAGRRQAAGVGGARPFRPMQGRASQGAAGRQPATRAQRRQAQAAPMGRRQPISRAGAQRMRSANGPQMSSRTTQTTRRARGSAGGKHDRKPDRRKSRRRVLPFVLIAVAIVAIAGVLVVPRLMGSSKTKATKAGQSVTVNIPEGSGGSAIAKILLDAGVISDEQTFTTEVKRQNADSSMKSGTYNLTTGEDVSEVVSRLVTGPNSSKGTVTVSEGLTVKKTAELVESSLGIKASDFEAQAKASNYSDKYAFLANVQNDSLEGFLYPQKYDFGSVKNLTADKVITAMLDAYQKNVASLDFATAEANIKSTYGLSVSDYDVLKLASIIEREAVSDDDRPKVASVFYNRLQKDMPLQSDATMAYVTGGEVTADDLKQSSPYNTYLNKGLPPTPICTPSIKSIQAALSPAKTNYYYFLIIENGSYSNHTFSETYEQHEQAIAKAKSDQGKSGSDSSKSSS
ncbi:MAG: endolytic transglycosylase MltG [Parafannyhessea sp.]|uniref:endolytic transglycosylase MltG n=1 Tax=Parafannyhessea sp. TaxID=2847324 RepID=UPI003F00A79B